MRYGCVACRRRNGGVRVLDVLDDPGTVEARKISDLVVITLDDVRGMVEIG